MSFMNTLYKPLRPFYNPKYLCNVFSVSNNVSYLMQEMFLHQDIEIFSKSTKGKGHVGHVS